MPVDADAQTLTQWLLTAIGIGGGGYKLVTHETRIARLETDREKDINKLDRVVNVVAGMDSKLDALQQSIDRNANLYVARRKQYIHDSGGEVDE